MENQAVQPNPHIISERHLNFAMKSKVAPQDFLALRVGSILARALQISVGARGFFFLMPEYNMILADPLGLFNTCFAHIVVHLVWTLMTLIFAISICRMVAIVRRRETLRTLCLTLLRNPLRLALLIFVLAYDALLIRFIYITWTVNLALGCRFFQFLPASTLLLHSAVEQCFLAMVRGNEVYRRDIHRFTGFPLAVNFTMLIHLIITGMVVGSKFISEPSLFLGTLLFLMSFELFYRLMAIDDWRDASNGDDCMGYLSESFADEQHCKTTQLVAGGILCLYSSGGGNMKAQMMTGHEERCHKDEPASLSNSSS